MAIKQARIMCGATYAAESINTDLAWVVQTHLPDPHVLLEFELEDGRWERLLLANSLEYTRLVDEAKNCTVVNISPYQERLNTLKITPVVKALTEERGAGVLIVHPLTPLEFVEGLQHAGVVMKAGKQPWYPERLKKTEEEIGHILEAQGHVEDVLRLVENRLRSASIDKNGFVCEGGKPLTSEELRTFVESELYARGCNSLDTIISSGADAASPHKLGAGPILARTGIICDIFPYSRRTGFYADMTRTFIKGEPSEFLVKMYESVLRRQMAGIAMIRPGVDGRDIQIGTERGFEEDGFRTDTGKGEGFVHGFGHGLGLLCHEGPARISRISYILAVGNVVSAEPGLYYPKEGLAVRIEDLVQVTANGCRNLTSYPKKLEDMVIP